MLSPTRVMRPEVGWREESKLIVFAVSNECFGQHKISAPDDLMTGWPRWSAEILRPISGRRLKPGCVRKHRELAGDFAHRLEGDLGDDAKRKLLTF
jgi:hypothetical protein